MSSVEDRQRAVEAGGYRPFGAFRFALAGMVLAQHAMKLLTPGQQSAFFGLVLGPVAVACFFALSAFIVAEALTRFYARRPLAFLGNRGLRVVPPYLVALALAVLAQSALFAAGRLVPLDNPIAGAPWQPRLILAGALEIVPGLPASRLGGQDFSFIPYAWTLRVEFAFYLAAFATCALAARIGRPRGWVVGFALAVAYASFGRFLLAHGAGTQQILCVPFFAFGLACFLLGRRPGAASIAHVLAVSAFVPVAFPYWAQKGHPVVAYQLAWLCLLFGLFFGLTRIARVPQRVARLDRWLGDLSYPLYIGHGVALVLLMSLAPNAGWPLFAAGIAASLLLAAALHMAVERPLRGLRDRLRGRPV